MKLIELTNKQFIFKQKTGFPNETCERVANKSIKNDA